MVHCEDAAFRAFRVGTGANTAVIKGFFLPFFFFHSFFVECVVCSRQGRVQIKQPSVNSVCTCNSRGKQKLTLS